MCRAGVASSRCAGSHPAPLCWTKSLWSRKWHCLLPSLREGIVLEALRGSGGFRSRGSAGSFHSRGSGRNFRSEGSGGGFCFADTGAFWPNVWADAIWKTPFSSVPTSAFAVCWKGEAATMVDDVARSCSLKALRRRVLRALAVEAKRLSMLLLFENCAPWRNAFCSFCPSTCLGASAMTCLLALNQFLTMNFWPQTILAL